MAFGDADVPVFVSDFATAMTFGAYTGKINLTLQDGAIMGRDEDDSSLGRTIKGLIVSSEFPNLYVDQSIVTIGTSQYRVRDLRLLGAEGQMSELVLQLLGT